MSVYSIQRSYVSKIELGIENINNAVNKGSGLYCRIRWEDDMSGE
jgi:hypothetical protein